MTTMIAVPCMDAVDSFFCKSLSEMQPVGKVSYQFAISSMIYTARNELAAKAIDMEADYILWLDSDMVFPADLHNRLMTDIKGRDFVSGVYFMRKPPFHPLVWEKFRTPSLDQEDVNRKYFRYPENGLFEIEACGFGCVLMRTSMIEPMVAKFGTLFGPLPAVGEDLSFCARARACGFKMWADPRISLGHRGYFISDQSYWKAYQNEYGNGGGDHAGRNEAGAEDRHGRV